jgi:two-component system chemotaxis response regulator CheY
MKILIADDSDFMRTILKSIVEKSKWKGAIIIEATNGADAIAMYQSEHPDLVLLDIVMPEHTGIEVLQAIGAAPQSVVMVSSVEEQQVVDQAKQLGAKEYINKPFDTDHVIEVLNSLAPPAPNQGQ